MRRSFEKVNVGPSELGEYCTDVATPTEREIGRKGDREKGRKLAREIAFWPSPRLPFSSS
jgi:hypothetical protein